MIPTADLFRMRRDIAAGQLAPEDAQELLMSTTGVLEYPSIPF